MKAVIPRKRRKRRIVVLGSALAVTLYVSAYAFLTAWISPSVPEIVEGRGRTLFVFFMPVRTPVDGQEWEDVSPHPLDRLCSYVFCPLLLLEKECGWRLHDDFVFYANDGSVFLRD